MSSLMSFLTLGLTADAAAAHRHEYSSDTHPVISRSASPLHRPQSPAMSQDIGSVALPYSSDSVTAVPSIDLTPHPKPRPPRAKTVYQLAAPPPSTHTNRLHTVVRPSRALVLQLQRLFASARPLPTLDVIPALAFAAKTKRKRPLNFRGNLGMHDFVIVQSEDHMGVSEEDEAEDEDLSSRNVIASICPIPKKDREEDGIHALLELVGGVVWEASHKENGQYEFVHHQPNGAIKTVRWISRIPHAKRRFSGGTPIVKDGSVSFGSDKRWQFTMINSGSRKHPIMGDLSGQRLEIYDQHVVSVNHRNRQNNSSQGSFNTDTASTQSDGAEVEQEKILVETDEYMKTLILVTGIWVAMSEGFNGRIWFDGDLCNPTTPARSSFSGKSPTTPTRPSNRMEQRYSDTTPMDKVLRRGTLLGHQATTGQYSPIDIDHSVTKRSNSTGSAFRRTSASSVIRSRFSSPPSSPLNSRAPSPEFMEITIPQIRSPIPNEVETPVVPPVRRGTPFLHFRREHQSSLSVPIPEHTEQNSVENNRRKSTPPRFFSGKSDRSTGPTEKRGLKQKISRVFSLIKRGDRT